MILNKDKAIIFIPFIAVVLIALGVYIFVARDLMSHPSVTPYFVSLSDAFLHGQTAITPPDNPFDLILYGEQFYVAQQPLPALLLLPFVALFGAVNVSDVAFGLVIGTLNVLMCYRVLRLFSPELGFWRLSILTLFFGLGTTHFWMSTLGTVWFLGQLCATLFLWIFIEAILRRQPLLAGIALALVALGRPAILPGALIIAVGWWWNDVKTTSLPALRRPLLLFLFPLVVSLLFLGWYNWDRFGNPIDFGYSNLQDAPAIQERRLQHGSFNLIFLPENLYTATIKPPLSIRFDCLQKDACGALTPDQWGLGLLWASPLLLYGLLATSDKRFRLIAVSVFVILLPDLLYHNTGSIQFGYRFAMDAIPIWMLMVAKGAKRGPIWLLAGIALYCIAVNYWGTRWITNLIVFGGDLYYIAPT